MLATGGRGLRVVDDALDVVRRVLERLDALDRGTLAAAEYLAACGVSTIEVIEQADDDGCSDGSAPDRDASVAPRLRLTEAELLELALALGGALLFDGRLLRLGGGYGRGRAHAWASFGGRDRSNDVFVQYERMQAGRTLESHVRIPLLRFCGTPAIVGTLDGNRALVTARQRGARTG